MLQTARAMPAQLCLHRRRDEQIRFAPDRSDSRACDHRCAARSADGGGSARQRRRERSEAARAADREAEVHDRQAPSPAVRSILGARRDPRAARAAAFRAAGGCLRGRGDGAAGGSRGGEREDQEACPREGGGAGLRAPQAGAPSAARASAARAQDRKSTRLNSSHSSISYAVFCLKKKKKIISLYQAKKQKLLKEL